MKPLGWTLLPFSNPKYRFLRMKITQQMGFDIGFQFSSMEIEKSDGTLFTWPKDIDCNGTIDGEKMFEYERGADWIFGTFTQSESIYKLIDGNLSTKFCVRSDNRYPIIIVFDLKMPIFSLKECVKWRWYTANDVPARDPSSFSLEASVDGKRWDIIDIATNLDVTKERKSLAYVGILKKRIRGGGN